MDNLTHSLVGWALAETGLKRRTRKGLAACVLAANMPDVDVVFGWAPWAPLATHRGFTHGLVGGVLLMPPVLAGLLWLIDRWQARRGQSFAQPMHFGWLLALCYLGAITHPLLDLQNTYAVQLLSPASMRWYHTDGLFIVSPWVLAMLGLGIWLARRQGKGRPAILALTGVIAFIALNIGISALAGRAVGGQPDRLFASPEPLAFWRRDVVWREGGTIHFARYDLLFSLARLSGVDESRPDRMNERLVRGARDASPAIRKFLAWSQLPFASVRQEGCDSVVTFGDARFMGPRTRGNFTVSVTAPGGCAPGSPQRR